MIRINMTLELRDLFDLEKMDLNIRERIGFLSHINSTTGRCFLQRRRLFNISKSPLSAIHLSAAED
jgi:hypothetical protein